VTVPERRVRAKYSAESITVYQAYSPEIAEPAALPECATVGAWRLSAATRLAATMSAHLINRPWSHGQSH
jgi:hypothetical protein